MKTVWTVHGYVGHVSCVRERTAEGWTVSLFCRDDAEPTWTKTVEDLEAADELAEHYRQALLVQGFFGRRAVVTLAGVASLPMRQVAGSSELGPILLAFLHAVC